mgnify:CR=1 FL=1
MTENQQTLDFFIYFIYILNMDQNIIDQNLTSNEKNNIYDELYAIVYNQLKNNQINVDEGKEIADLVLTNLEKISTKKELIEFLKTLVKKWSFFSSVLIKKNYELEQLLEKKQIAEITQRLNKFLN